MNKEKGKAAAAIKSIQEQAEQKLKEELQRKVMGCKQTLYIAMQHL